jgi:hypothetical protein
VRFISRTVRVSAISFQLSVSHLLQASLALVKMLLENNDGKKSMTFTGALLLP